MKWFKHFSNAHDNNDLTKVRMKFGAEGYAVYWYCLELIASDLGTDENINFELKHDAEVIGFNLKVDSARVEEIMRFMVTLGLFEQCRSTITCLKLAKYLDKKTTRNSTIHKIIEAAHLSGTNTDSPVTLPDESGRSPLDTDTDTDIKPIYASGDALLNQFAEFWKAYPKKKNKGDAEKAWKKLKPTGPLVDQMLKSIQTAKTTEDWKKDNGQFIPYPASWLNAKGWEDEFPSQRKTVSMVEGAI